MEEEEKEVEEREEEKRKEKEREEEREEKGRVPCWGRHCRAQLRGPSQQWHPAREAVKRGKERGGGREREIYAMC